MVDIALLILSVWILLSIGAVSTTKIKKFNKKVKRKLSNFLADDE